MNLSSAYRIPDLDELEAVRPRKGDLVSHGEDEELYVVDEIGMRFLVVHKQDNPKAQRWFKHHEVIRWTPPDDQPTGREPIDLAAVFPGIGPRD
jgi:hypothetical protein